MANNYQRVEGEPDLAKDSSVPGVVINRNKSAYEKAKARSEESRIKLLEEEGQRDTIRNATREINTLKSEMHEIKSLLQQLVDK